MKNLFLRAFPWIFAALICFYLFRKMGGQPLQFQTLQMLPFFVSGIIYFFVQLFFDTFSLAKVLQRFVGTVSTQQILRARGASFLFGVLHYGAGQGALTLFLRRFANLKISRTAGAILFISAIDFSWMAVSVFVAVIWGWEDPALQQHREVFLSVSFVLMCLLLMGFFLVRFLPSLKSSWFLAKPVQKILRHELFHIVHETSFVETVRFALTRLPLVVVVLIGLRLSFFGFGINCSWWDIFLFGPILILVGLLPLTPLGIGTTQYLLIEIFKSRVEFSASLLAQGQSLTEIPQILLTSSFAWLCLIQICRVVFGATMWARVPKIDREHFSHDVQKYSDAADSLLDVDSQSGR